MHERGARGKEEVESEREKQEMWRRVVEMRGRPKKRRKGIGRFREGRAGNLEEGPGNA